LPAGVEGLSGVIAIDTNLEGTALTVSVVDAVIELDETSIVAFPGPIAAARPPLVIVATPGDEEVHLAAAVKSFVLLSKYLPTALNCCVLPTSISGSAGVNSIETRLGAGV